MSDDTQSFQKYIGKKVRVFLINGRTVTGILTVNGKWVNVENQAVSPPLKTICNPEHIIAITQN